MGPYGMKAMANDSCVIEFVTLESAHFNSKRRIANLAVVFRVNLGLINRKSVIVM